MGYKTIALLLAFVALSACAQMRDNFKRGWDDFVQDVRAIRMGGREVGEASLALPDKVWADHGCGARKLPYFVVEESDIAPKRLRRGQEVKHRLVYSLCPEKPSQVVPGTLALGVYFKGKKVFEDIDRNAEMKPGKWRVDSIITIPPQADAGVYSIKAEFRSKKVSFDRSVSFIVEAG